MKKYIDVSSVLAQIAVRRENPLWAAGLDEARKIIEEEYDKWNSPRGVYECFHCGSLAVVWDCDYSYEDYGLDGDGIVQELHCADCGANISYFIDLSAEEDG